MPIRSHRPPSFLKSQARSESLRPTLSVLLIVLSLFAIAFVQMEERRLGYEVLQLSRDAKKKAGESRRLRMEIAKKLGPMNVERVAQDQLNLRRTREDQIIRLAEPTLAAREP